MSTPATPSRLPIPQGAQLSLRLSQNGQESVVVLGFLNTTSLAINEAAANALRDHAWLKLAPLMSQDVTSLGAVLRDVSVLGGTAVEVGPSGVAVAQGPNSTHVAAACTLIKWSTAAGGRSGKGRTFLPGLPGGAVTNTRSYTASFAGSVTTAVTNYLTEMTFGQGGFKPAVLSFRRGEANRITAGALAPVVGIQRRRMR